MRNIIIFILSCMTFLRGIDFDPSYEKLNEAFGAPIFQDDNLWDDDEKEVAKRLNWPQESRTDTLASYRLYAKPDVVILGTRPYSLALYAEKGLVQQLSLMFSNKGDFEEANPDDAARTGRKKAEVDPKVIKLLKASIKKDEEIITARITGLLGESKFEVIGVRDQSEKTRRWDWKGHALLLATPAGEYASVRVLPSDSADNDGKVGKISDDELKEVLLSRVERRENGDVIIQQIPMVDQGPKGYCVPATVERQLRFLGIPCDLYLLAMSGGTMLGGGTYVEYMMEQTKGLCSFYGRSIQFPKAEMNDRTFQKYIDKGLPLLWSCLVDREHDRVVSLRSKEREKNQDWTSWNSRLEDERKKKINKDPQSGHLRMIIGYNSQTREVAISDSWGEHYRERWMTYEEAQSISKEFLVAITW